jgi:hypothetical protein
MANYHVDQLHIMTIVGPARVNILGDHGDEPVVSPVTAPTVDDIDPDGAVCGDPDLTLTVTGEGFNELSKITFNGLDEPTKFISPTEINTGVKPSLFAVAAVCPVGVRTGGMLSNTVDFTFTEGGATRKRK